MTENQVANSVKVESLSHDGRGIVHINNKILFLENALPDEEVTFSYIRRHSKFDEAKVIEVLHPSPNRVTPKCPHANICGGCSLQHLEHTKQIEYKTKTLQEQMKHCVGLDINPTPPIVGPTWNYRCRARLSAKYVQKKEKVLVGFHEKNGRYVADITECPILHETVSNKILALSELVANLSIYNQIPQIETACYDNITALIFRHLKSFSDKDIELLKDFGKEHKFQIYLQSGGIDTIKPLHQDTSSVLSYTLSKQNIEILFTPADFTQINPLINQQLVAHVLKLLDVQPNDKVLDLFCGIGNFTLPIATKCAEIIGVEGSANSIARATQNSTHNNIQNTQLYCEDLFKESLNNSWLGKYDKVLLDPPRIGAATICSQIKRFAAKKIVYVSCNYATLIRDTKELLNNGYQLEEICVADMFPHTKHMEVVASFGLK